MANSKSSKKLMNMVYGLGAAVVILGALFKIMHWPFGNEMLIIGLITEALVFTVSAFEPVDDELDWSLVYPELAGGNRKDKKEVQTPEGMLSKKLDDMLKEARLDTSLMNSLGDSIRNFEGAAKGIAPSVDAIQGTKKYSEEMATAATHLESLNSLYKVQLESSAKQAEANAAIADNAKALEEQMKSLSSNLSSLNGVYGGMLSAMNRN
ncbi:gliding motility protein GldL [Aquimarina sp. BL5]|uniref:type IX secretion system motor protein PorL/GldL n=1 Tax=Aquimarina sp. BL5 TaxID=1714860 RepID=UPI000E513D10|nr:gliding motility protein GldL [Aquimarina sp. BL5]AXT52542.1 gliding motility protein GldL [Aquimarina sp. BL5]RKN11271.1 gliding motility protein GldL [Aquimarina sp. BL5]